MLKNTNYNMLPAQLDFISLPDERPDVYICCYQGGFGSGKSFSGSLLGILLSLAYPGVVGLVGALSWPLLRDTTLQAYYQHFNTIGWEDGLQYRFNKQEKQLYLKNGSRILFRHLEDGQNVRSLNLAWAHIEEGSQVSEAAIMEVIGRLRDPRIKTHRLFITTNPQSQKGWLYSMFENQGVSVKDTDGIETSIYTKRVFAPSTQNVNLPPGYLALMAEKFDEEYYRMNVLGEDGDYSSGLVVKGWTKANERDDISYNPDYTLHLTCDFNVDPMCWLICQRINGEYYFIDEITIENTTTTRAVEEFFRRYPPEKVKSGLEINGDAAGNQRRTEAQEANSTNYTIMLNNLSRLGYRDVWLNVRDANPRIDSRLAAFNGAVCSKSGVRKIFVNPEKCKWLMYNIENLMHQTGNNELETPSVKQMREERAKKYLVHPIDAASYIVEKYDPIVLEVKKDIKVPEPVLNYGF